MLIIIWFVLEFIFINVIPNATMNIAITVYIINPILCINVE